MAIKPIKRAGIGDLAFHQLKEQIWSGEWKQGDRLPSENELAGLLGVSRVTVRQAIQRLSAMGLVETKLGDGSYVRSLTPGLCMNRLIPALYLSGNSLREALEFRRILESPTAALAAEKAGPEDVERLEHLLEQMRNAQEEDASFSEADFAFHNQLGAITGNSLIMATYEVIGDVLKTAMGQIVRYRGHSQGLHYHALLLGAVKARDPERCRRIMQEHVDDTYHSIIQILETDHEAAANKRGSI